jgi:hypothetical protein
VLHLLPHAPGRQHAVPIDDPRPPPRLRDVPQELRVVDAHLLHQADAYVVEGLLELLLDERAHQVSGEQELLILERVGVVDAAVAGGEGVQLAYHEEDVLELVAVAREVDEDVPFTARKKKTMQKRSVLFVNTSEMKDTYRRYHPRTRAKNTRSNIHPQS